MSENTANTNRNNWVFALIASIAINGLLGGLLLAKGLGSKPAAPETAPAKVATVSTGPNNPRKILRALPVQRRKQVLRAAMKNIKPAAGERPRVLFSRLHKAQKHVLEISQKDKFDEEALKLALADVRRLKQDVAMQGDALIIEVLKLLTPAEKQLALENMKTGRRKHNGERRRERD